MVATKIIVHMAKRKCSSLCLKTGLGSPQVPESSPLNGSNQVTGDFSYWTKCSWLNLGPIYPAAYLTSLLGSHATSKETALTIFLPRTRPSPGAPSLCGVLPSLPRPRTSMPSLARFFLCLIYPQFLFSSMLQIFFGNLPFL